MLKCLNNTSDVHWKVDPIAGTYTLHDIGWRVAMLFAIISSVIAFFLIWRHAAHYSRPNEQRHIIRILFMIPIYSLISAGAYAIYWYAPYLIAVRGCYEAFAIASFFSLMCSYIAPDLSSLKHFFRRKQPDPWPWPLTWTSIRLPRSGLTWFNIVWIGVFQYCFVLVAITLLTLTTEALDIYCESSMSPKYAHVWVIAFQTISVTVAMYLLFAFYFTISTEIKAYSPVLKLLSIKLVIFFTFWQNLLITFLVNKNVLKTSNKISLGDLNVGISTMLINVEMLGFAILHLWAFPWREYTAEGIEKRNMKQGIEEGPTTYKGFWRAMVDSMNPWDFVKAFARGMRWLVFGRKYRHTESLYAKDEISMGHGGFDGHDSSGAGSHIELKNNDNTRATGGVEEQGLLPGAQGVPDSSPPRGSPFHQYQTYESLRGQETGPGPYSGSLGDEEAAQPRPTGLRPAGATAAGAFEPYRHH